MYSVKSIEAGEAKVGHQILPPFIGDIEFCLSTLISQLFKIN